MLAEAAHAVWFHVEPPSRSAGPKVVADVNRPNPGRTPPGKTTRSRLRSLGAHLGALVLKPGPPRASFRVAPREIRR